MPLLAVNNINGNNFTQKKDLIYAADKRRPTLLSKFVWSSPSPVDYGISEEAMNVGHDLLVGEGKRYGLAMVRERNIVRNFGVFELINFCLAIL